jgi:hypothetical protein
MNLRTIIILFALVATPASATFAEFPNAGIPGVPIKVALLPFEVQGLAAEDGVQLTRIFRESLVRSNAFEVMHPDTMMSLFTEAEVTNLEGCNYSYCLADLGKILGVEKVIHVNVTRRGKLYVLRVRLVNSADASIVYDQRAEYSGEFSMLASDVVPAQANRLAETKLETGTRWYVIAAAVILGVGAIYWIYRSFSKDAAAEDSGGGPPSTQQ